MASCAIKIGSHAGGWNHGTVETLPAYYQDYDYEPKDPNNAEAKALVERINKIYSIELLQAYGTHLNEPINISGIEVVVDGKDVAKDGTATMSSQHAHYGPANVIDGKTNTIAHTNNKTSDNDPQWIKVSFKEAFDFRKLDYIKIKNRRDCCHNRTHGLILSLRDANGRPVRRVTLQSVNMDQVFRRSDLRLYKDWRGKGPAKDAKRLLKDKPGTRDFQHYRLHDGTPHHWDTVTGTKGQFKIGNDDIDIMETEGDCKDVLWMYSDHGVLVRDGYTKDLNNNSFEKFKETDGTIVPVNPGYNKLNDWQYYPAHGYFMNQISELWAKPVPTDKYNDDMDVHGLIRSGHATIWRDAGGDRKKQANALFYGQDGRFMEQDPTTTLACGTNHHNPHTECTSGKVVGEPCPGGKMHWLNSQKVRCYYETPEEIQTLKNALASTPSNDPRLKMYENIKSKFCAEPGNLNKTIDGKKCKEWGDAEKLTRDYCTANDWEKMKAKDNACTRTGMPNEDLFESLSSEFCNANAGDSWCKCYNQVKNVCKTKNDAAGCKDVDDQIAEILKDLPKDGSGTIAKNEVNARRHCWAGVCSNDKDAFVPRERKDCNLNVCIQSLQTGGHLVDSDVQMTCETEETTDDEAMKKYKEDSEKYNLKLGGKDSKGFDIGKDVAVVGGGLAASIFLMFCCLMVMMMM